MIGYGLIGFMFMMNFILHSSDMIMILVIVIKYKSWSVITTKSSNIGNTAAGYESLRNLTSGRLNTAVGAKSQLGNRTGNENASVGFDALAQINGVFNTAMGNAALLHLKMDQ